MTSEIRDPKAETQRTTGHGFRGPRPRTPIRIETVGRRYELLHLDRTAMTQVAEGPTPTPLRIPADPAA